MHKIIATILKFAAMIIGGILMFAGASAVGIYGFVLYMLLANKALPGDKVIFGDPIPSLKQTIVLVLFGLALMVVGYVIKNGVYYLVNRHTYNKAAHTASCAGWTRFARLWRRR